MKLLFLFSVVAVMVVAGVFSWDRLNNFSRIEVAQAPLANVTNITPLEDENFSNTEEAFVEIFSSTTLEVKNDAEKTVNEVVIKNKEETNEEPQKKLELGLNLLNLRQGQVLLVEVLNHFGREVSVIFLDRPITVFPINNRLIAFIGIDAKQTPGNYKLTVSAEGEEVQKTVTIKDAKFPVTKIVVTPKLEEQGFTPESIVQSFEKNENVQLKEAMEVSSPIPYFSESFRVPLDKTVVVGNFGNIRQEGESAFQHLGVDLDATIGTPVYAMNSGKVVFQKNLPTYGNTVIIDHGIGIFSIYLHLSEFLRNPGEKVEKGDLVARTGNTGYSVDPHLHLSLKINGSSVDPLEFVKVSAGLK